MISDVMRAYGMSYADMRALPMSAFWELSRNIPRLQATDDLRQLRVLSVFVGGGDDVVQAMLDERGVVAQAEDSGGFDRDGLGRFKEMLGM